MPKPSPFQRPKSPPLPRSYANTTLVHPHPSRANTEPSNEATSSQEISVEKKNLKTTNDKSEESTSKEDDSADTNMLENNPPRKSEPCLSNNSNDSVIPKLNSKSSESNTIATAKPKTPLQILSSKFKSSSPNDCLALRMSNTPAVFNGYDSLGKPDFANVVEKLNTITTESGLSGKASGKLAPKSESIIMFGTGTMTPCCRICHSGVSREQLISPCNCKGSLGHVHRSCLEQWLNEAGRSTCELCFHQYNAIQTRRYRCCESLHVWVRHPRNRTHVQADFLICGLLTIVTIGLVMVCLLGMQYFVLEGLKLGITHAWTQGAVVIFLSIVILGYVVTLYLLIRDQIMPWYIWWRNAVTVRLLMFQPSTNGDVETQL